MVLGGYMGRILYVDLTTEQTRVESLDPYLARSIIGGSGLAVSLLLQLGADKVEPLDPESPLIFAVGPLAGTRVPLSGRFVVAARSPLTGLYGEAESGNSFAVGLKAAGYDALVVTGRAERPVYLSINDDQVQIRPADHLWGQDTFAAGEAVQQETHPRAGVALIGQGGENLVPMAGIIADVPDARAAARCGMGAVMGSKRLKAIAAHGTRPTAVAEPDRLDKAIKSSVGTIVARTKRLKEFGSAGGTVGNAVIGDMGAKNWTVGDWTGPAEKIGGEAMAAEILKGRYYCPTCVIGCGRKVSVDTGPHAGTVAGGPEYETVAGFGAQVLVDDIRRIAEANDLCNRYGLDTISVSGVIAFAIEAMDRGLLGPDSDLPAEPLWGNPDLVIALIHKIALRQGIGELLCLGSRAAAARLGSEAEHFAMHVKGLELPYHDPRALSSLAAGYATNPRGGCHRGCTHYVERYGFPELDIPEALPRQADHGKGRAAAILQNYGELYQCLKLCHFQLPAVTPQLILDWFNAVTGLDFDLQEFLAVGERVFTLKRIFNHRCGAGPEHDTLPPRLLTEAYPTGGASGFVPDLAVQLADYYAARGWDEAGRPRPETLQRLGIDL